MKNSTNPLKADLLLLLTALVWGLAFVAQRMGMEHIGPFLFNGIRFALGATVLIIFIQIRNDAAPERKTLDLMALRKEVWAGVLLGLVLFLGASLQQVGIVYTSAGNAGFITGLYVILVPIIGIPFGQKPGWGVWTGAILAAVGMYFLSVTSSLSISKGDLLVLASALVWAVHVQLIGWMSPRMSALNLSAVQFIVTSFLSFAVAIPFEVINLDAIREATMPILYGGLISVGIGYTLQVVAQKNAPPAHAAIILSLEAVFAFIGGVLILDEATPFRKLLGAALMFAGMILAQVQTYFLNKKKKLDEAF